MINLWTSTSDRENRYELEHLARAETTLVLFYINELPEFTDQSFRIDLYVGTPVQNTEVARQNVGAWAFKSSLNLDRGR